MTGVKIIANRKPARPVSLSGTPSLLAAGGICALLAGPATAIELGELQVESALGQPLRASIAFALGPNEQIANQCVYLRAATPGGSLPTITRATATLRGNLIQLRGNTPLREPMMNLQVAVDCAYTPRLHRDYLVMLNPPGLSEPELQPLPTAAAVASEPASRPVRTTRRAAATPARRRPAMPVASGSPYRVQPGDTLSEIVSRIENRSLALWPAVNAIHAANPDAFLDRDVDRLVAGSTLVIPAEVTGTVTTSRTAPAVVVATVEQPAARRYQSAAEAVPTRTEAALQASTPPAATMAPTLSAQATDAVTASDAPATDENVSPFVDEIDTQADISAEAAAPVATISIPDTRIEQESMPPIAVGATGGESPAQAWLVWLGGTGIAIVLGLLLFGRRLREKFGQAQSLEDTQVNTELPQRRATDRGEEPDVDSLNLRDTLSKADPFEVQVNLDDGTGFDTSEDVDVALNYSFASSGDYSDDIDLVLDKHGDSNSQTDIMSAPHRDSAIEVSEVDPDGENTGYDMSVVVDVTKQDFVNSEATTRDLQAIEVRPLHMDPGQSGTMELTSDGDYDVLEQDYEDELTATQILNRDIEQAAMELQDRLGEFDDDQSRISMAEDLEGTAEITAEMPSSGRADNDTMNAPGLDDTDISDEPTEKLPDSDDATVEMNTDADETVERRSKTG